MIYALFIDNLLVQADGMMHSLAKYLMELSLTEYDMAHVHPSELAGAALCLSMKILNEKDESDWSNTLIYYSGYQQKDLLPSVAKLALVLKNSEKAKHQVCLPSISSVSRIPHFSVQGCHPNLLVDGDECQLST